MHERCPWDVAPLFQGGCWLPIAVRHVVQELVNMGSSLSPGGVAFVPTPSQQGT